MDPTSPEGLFAALRSSGQLTAEQLATLSTVPPDVVVDVAKLGDWLYAAELVTPYQGRKIRANRIIDLIVGQYLVVDKIGEGGMGKVYKAIQLRLGRTVALKVVRPHLMADRRVMRRWQREAKAASELVHPNIVALLDADEAQGRQFMAMEFVDGSDLSRLVKNFGSLHYAEAAEYVRQGALGLQYAHDKSYVHRDVKPSNFLVSGERAVPGTDGVAVVRILDMGLVRSLLDDESDVSRTELTRDGTVVGTPDYMSPEQAKNSSTVTARADIYSLGCTLVYLLTGRPPFPDGTPIDKLLRHQLDPPPDLRQLRPDMPVPMVLLIEQMLAKSPDDRPATATEVAERLGRIIKTGDPIILDAEAFIPSTGVGVVPEGDTVVTRVKKPNRKPKRISPPPADVPDESVRTPVSPRPTPIPLPGSAVSSDSLPATDGLTNDPSGDTTTSTDRTRRSTPRNRTVVRRKPKSNPWPVIAAVAGTIVLGVTATVMFLRPQSEPITKPTPEASPKPVPVPEVTGKIVLPAAYANLPDGTQAVLIVHPELYWPRGRAKLGQRTATAAGQTEMRYRFELSRADRLTWAGLESGPGPWVATTEGGFVDVNWTTTTRTWKRVTEQTRGGQSVLAFGRDRGGPVFGVVLPQRGFSMSEDSDLLTAVVKRPRDRKPTLPKAILAALPDPIDPNRPVMTFAAAGRWQPHGDERLSDFGVDAIVVRATLTDEQFDVTLSIVGKGETELRRFLNVELFSRIVTRVPGLVKFVTPVASNDSSLGFQSVPGGQQIQMTINGTWPIVEAHEWFELMLEGMNPNPG